jgi:hypothetical protein
MGLIYKSIASQCAADWEFKFEEDVEPGKRDFMIRRL